MLLSVLLYRDVKHIMSKKKRRTAYTSKGQRRNVNKDILKSMRRLRCPLERAINQLDACKNNKHTLLSKNITSKINRKGAFYV